MSSEATSVLLNNLRTQQQGNIQQHAGTVSSITAMLYQEKQLDLLASFVPLLSIPYINFAKLAKLSLLQGMK